MKLDMQVNKQDVTFKNVSFYRQDRCIIHDLNLFIPQGKITAIIGPSGVGKTTLLRLISGHLKSHRGHVYIGEHSINEATLEDLYTLRRGMGMLFQSNALFAHLSVFENVAYPIREHLDLNESLIEKLVLMKLESVGLRGAKDLMPDALSGGMARRVALSRAVVMDPGLMMYDEPFTGQDPISIGVLINLIAKMKASLHMTQVIISHQIDVMMPIVDHMHLMSEGKIIASGSPQELNDSQDQRVIQFMKGLPDGVVPFHYPATRLDEEMIR